MKVLIDAHMLGEQEGGNETYVAGLLAGFEALGPDAGAAVTALFSPGYRPGPMRHVATLQLQGGGAARRLLHELPAASRAAGADLLHVTYNAPPLGSCPTIVSVHDVLYRRYPAYFAPRVRLLLNTLLPLSMRRARAVLTLSEASRREIVHFYPFVRDKIAVVGLAGPVAQGAPDTAGAAPYIEGGPFILAVGTVQPRKNIARLIEAYILARRRGLDGVRLLIVGRSRWQGSEIQRIAAASPYSDDIVFTGYLDDAVVAALYRSCAVFAYPSLAEGFGLPVLEAMAYGAPVITSDRSSLPEVAGDAALLVDPTSVEQLSAALERVLRDGALQAELRARGAARAARYSWERVARETLDVYRQAARLRSLA